jgi:hypothetical protein
VNTPLAGIPNVPAPEYVNTNVPRVLPPLLRLNPPSVSVAEPAPAARETNTPPVPILVSNTPTVSAVGAEGAPYKRKVPPFNANPVASAHRP